MNFAPKDLCEKLVKMGCRTSGFYHYGGDQMKRQWLGVDGGITYSENVSAFTLEDFVANTEQAKENAKIVWNEELKSYGLPPPTINHEYYRHLLIDAPDPWKFLEETMREK